MIVVMHLISGLLFGIGLAVSGLINPAKVQNFLDITGTWDPSLAFTMGAAVITTAIGYALVFRRSAPLCDTHFHVPEPQSIDARLIAGAALFGIGWGSAGYCPGPALSALSQGASGTYVFVIAMLAGMALARWSTARKNS
ncbi:MAG: YeeE/YedE family protein [Hyphomicrobium sp.]